MDAVFTEICKAMHTYQKPDVQARQFAIAIVMPGVGGTEIVNATMRHNVHILNKELYCRGKDYTALLQVAEEDTAVALLFIFKDGSSVSVSDYARLVEVISGLEELADATLS